MARRAAGVTVTFSAGSATFRRDVDQNTAKIRQFGAHTTSSMAASSAAIRTLEGNFDHNLRAVERFLGTTLKLGPVLQAAFPIVGGVAFAGLLVDIGEKVVKFVRDIQTAPEKIRGAFRELNAPLRLTNDELDLANSRLEADIAKLEGKRQNTLAIALNEAKVAADKLADSLDKDLGALHKLLDEQQASWYQRLLTGEGSTKDIVERLGGKTGFGGFRGEIAEKMRTGRDQIADAKTLNEAGARREQLARVVDDAYQKQIEDFEARLATARKKAEPIPQFVTTGPNGEGYETLIPGQEQTRTIEGLTGALERLKQERLETIKSIRNTELQQKDTQLHGAKDDARLDKPFNDRMKAMAAQLEAVRQKLTAIGQPEAAQVLAKAFGDAGKTIEEVNKALERQHTKLSNTEEASIVLTEMEIASAEAEAQWKTKLDATSTSIEERIRAQELLTAAIGKGYEATKRASVESQVVRAVGSNFGDANWMKDHAADVAALRGRFEKEFEAQHGEQVAAAIDGLNQQISLERQLAAVQTEGAGAVRDAAFAHKIAILQQNGATDEQIQAERDLYAAQKANLSADNIAKLKEKTDETERLTAAIMEGAEAERLAALENKYAAMRRGGSSEDEIAAARKLDQVEHQGQVTREAIRTGMVYKDQLESLNQQIEALKKTREAQGDNLAIELALRDLENQRLQALANYSLSMGRARDGVRAFFIEMQESGRTAAQNIYEALHSTFDKLTTELGKLATGQKTSFGKTFQSIGQEMVTNQIRSIAQKGLAALGKKFGIDVGQGKPDGTRSNPLWVQMADASAIANPAGIAGKLGGLFGGGDKGGGIFSFLGSLGSLIPHADGGFVSPNSAYLVGERGPEPFFPGTSGYMMSAAASRRSSGGETHMYTIDARGTDPVLVEQRVKAAILAAHDSAVTKSVQVNHDQARRVPGKG